MNSKKVGEKEGNAPVRVKVAGKSLIGQSAIEYMTTYGWAVLLILIVGMVLWQMGAFTPPSPPPGCRGFSHITVLDHSASRNDNMVYLVLTNEAGTKLRISSGGISSSIADVSCDTAPSSDIDPFRPGQGVRVNISCSDLSANYAAGEYYRVHINISYTNPSSGMTHKSAGECWGSVE